MRLDNLAILENSVSRFDVLRLHYCSFVRYTTSV